MTAVTRPFHPPALAAPVASGFFAWLQARGIPAPAPSSAALSKAGAHTGAGSSLFLQRSVQMP